MKGLRGTIVALGIGLGAISTVELAEMGCGDDTSGAPLESNSDATADSKVAADSGSGATSGDGNVVDGPDSMPHVRDAATDGAPIGLVVATNEATAFCHKLLGCCDSRLDGGTYDTRRCIDSLVTFGWEGTLPADPRVYYRNHIDVDQAKAAGCVSALSSLPCGTQTPLQWGAITSACELVITGTMPSNSLGCISSFECAPGNYCDPNVDGGLCMALASQGQACNTRIRSDLNPVPDEMCSYLGSGQPALFCDLIRNGPDAATCQPLLANGASCSNSASQYYDDQACSPPSLCGDNLRCGGTTSYPYVNFCQLYEIGDGGGSD